MLFDAHRLSQGKPIDHYPPQTDSSADRGDLRGSTGEGDRLDQGG